MTQHGLPVVAHRLPPAARGGHGRRVYSDREILDMYVLLHEAPHLISPEAFTARTTARTRAEVIRDKLEEYGMIIKVSTHYDDASNGYRWTLTNEGEYEDE